MLHRDAAGLWEQAAPRDPETRCPRLQALEKRDFPQQAAGRLLQADGDEIRQYRRLR